MSGKTLSRSACAIYKCKTDEQFLTAKDKDNHNVTIPPPFEWYEKTALYVFASNQSKKISIKINGTPVEYVIENGYAAQRTWKKADVIDMNLPMDVQRIKIIVGRGGQPNFES